MHFPNEPPVHVLPHAANLQHSAARPSGAALHQFTKISDELPPLRLEYQAARQVGPALAGRQVNKLIEAGRTELYPSLHKCQVILGHSRVTQQPGAAERPMSPQPFFGTMSHVLLGHMGGERLPSAEEQTALCSFLHRLDEAHSSAVQAGEHDLFMALAHQCDNDGHSLLYLSVSKGIIGVLQWLLNTQPASLSAMAPFTGKNDENTNPLLLAVEKGSERMARILLEKNADVNAVDALGRPLLYSAIFHGRENVTRLLLEKNVDIGFQDEFGRTPLHWAICIGSENIARLLLEKSADVNIVDNHVGSPLFLALSVFNYYDSRSSRIIRLLLQNGADVNIRSVAGKSLLCLAVECRDRNIARFFLDNNADINLGNNDGTSPLYRAVELCDANMVQFLLENNADVSCRTAGGATALHKAVEKAEHRVIRLLLQKRADANAQDNFGRSPLSLALDKGDESIIELLRGHNGGSVA